MIVLKRLFMTRRVKLTPEGMTYYQRAKDVLSNLSELDGLFQQDATSISGKLRIDIPPGIAKSLLLPRLSEFLYLHPGIELELSSHDRPVDILVTENYIRRTEKKQ